MDVFSTLDDLIAALDAPSTGDPVATARVTNALATANKKLSNSYDNVLTVTASVGARMNELEALDATGTKKGLTYAKSLSRTWKIWTTTPAPASLRCAKWRCKPPRRHS